jgi:TIR domain
MTGASGGVDPQVRPAWRWDVALSFAGAQRGYVEQVAQVLKARGVHCFYDADEQIELWGKYLAEELSAIYAEQTATVVVFVSAEYAARDWTRLERRAALTRAVQERREYVLPARFDDTPLPGLLADMVTVDLRTRTPQQFAAMIVGKLAALGIAAPTTSADVGSPARDAGGERPAEGTPAGEANLRLSVRSAGDKGAYGFGKGLRQAKILRVVVVSPGDVQMERDALYGIAAEINRATAADRGIRLELARWETDAYPGFHLEGPQGLIDPILRIADSDVVIGIFWKRFGTPTFEAGSGTEHEIQIAYEAWQRSGAPQIMVYFNERPSAPGSSAEADQWARVLRFKETFSKEGLWWTYKGRAQFEKLVRNHLSQFVRDHFPIQTDTADEGTLTDDAEYPSPAQAPNTAPAHEKNPVIRAVHALERQENATRSSGQPVWSRAEMEPRLKLQYVMAEIERYDLTESDKLRRKNEAFDRFMDEVWKP